MATNSKAPASKSTALAAPKPPPSPSLQAARERLAMINRARSAAPMQTTAGRKSQPLVPNARPSKETLGSIIGDEAPTLLAGAALGALNESELGKGISNRLNGIAPSRVVGAVAVVAKVLNVDGIAGPTVRQGLNAALRSEANDFARWGGGSLMSLIGDQLKKPVEEKSPPVETKVESSKPVVETSGITVKDVTPNASTNGANGAASHASTPKVTYEKNPSANA